VAEFLKEVGAHAGSAIDKRRKRNRLQYLKSITETSVAPITLECFLMEMASKAVLPIILPSNAISVGSVKSATSHIDSSIDAKAIPAVEVKMECCLHRDDGGHVDPSELAVKIQRLQDIVVAMRNQPSTPVGNFSKHKSPGKMTLRISPGYTCINTA
jgi:hypothetical protein